MGSISARWIEQQWRIENNAGNGSGIGDDETATPMEAAQDAGLQRIKIISPHNRGLVAGVNPEGQLVAIGDVYGPWACIIGGITADEWHTSLLEADN